MTVQKMDYNRVHCDYSECPMVINIATINTDHMRETLTANKWWMAQTGDIVHDELSGQDFIGYKTYCPKHKDELCLQ